MFATPNPYDENLLRVLDRKQERLARNLGTGYRLIRGVAGSGKTLVLTHRAIHMSSLLADWRILVLCFNRPLRVALQQQLEEHRNVTVDNLDALVWKICRHSEQDQDSAGTSAGTRRSQQRPDFDKRRRDTLQLVRHHLDDSQRYDMVLVEEAQDLDTVGLDLAWALLKQGRDNFVIALDSAQNIYRRRMAWNPPGMTARGRTTVLDINYRNTEQVLNLGLRILLGSRHDQQALSQKTQDATTRPSTEVLPSATTSGRRSADLPDSFNELVMPEKALRTGPEPKLRACVDRRAEFKAITQEVAQLLNQRAKKDDIVILLGTQRMLEDVKHGMVVRSKADLWS